MCYDGIHACDVHEKNRRYDVTEADISSRKDDQDVDKMSVDFDLCYYLGNLCLIDRTFDEHKDISTASSDTTFSGVESSQQMTQRWHWNKICIM